MLAKLTFALCVTPISTLANSKRSYSTNSIVLGSKDSGSLVSLILDTEVLIPSRIQLAPHARHARRRGVQKTVSERMPVLCANDAVAKSSRTGITIAYRYTEVSEDMLSRLSGEKHGLHNAPLTRRQYNLLGNEHDLEAR